MEEYTTDSFFNGNIKIKQHKSGYRFSVDAVLLANFIRPDIKDVIVDLGTGCGILPLILAYLYPKLRIYGIEVQKKLFELASQNVTENGLTENISIILMDMKNLKIKDISGTSDIVISNPPYRKINSGRINPNEERAIARHEILASIEDVTKIAARVLKKKGKFISIYPATRLADIITAMRTSKIEPKNIQMVYSDKGTNAKFILIEGIKEGGVELKVLPPIAIYSCDQISPLIYN
ncbi:MAG: tRNA1(Val) (adenine(37)-N6)-methyltransferase [Desulfobacterales bacterium]|nr:tRNA1(Val) (adenine(37)-N6)-methyltransferase [Desulfobacterales bacterium]